MPQYVFLRLQLQLAFHWAYKIFVLKCAFNTGEPLEKASLYNSMLLNPEGNKANLLGDYISDITRFWDWEESPYIREKLRKEHGIHRRYCKGQKSNVAMYRMPFFKGWLLGEITAKDVDDFIDHIGQKPFSASWKNLLIYTGTIPLSWAFSKGMIGNNPVNGHMKFSATPAKRPPAKASAVFNAPWPNEREMSGNLLASVTGMRLGEIQALRMRDIGLDCINVCVSWNPVDNCLFSAISNIFMSGRILCFGNQILFSISMKFLFVLI